MVDQQNFQTKLHQLNSFIQSDEILELDYRHVATDRYTIECTYAGVVVDLAICPHWSTPGDFFNFLEKIRPQKRTW